MGIKLTCFVAWLIAAHLQRKACLFTVNYTKAMASASGWMTEANGGIRRTCFSLPLSQLIPQSKAFEELKLPVVLAAGQYHRCCVGGLFLLLQAWPCFPQSCSALGRRLRPRGHLTQEPKHQKFDCMREEQWRVKTLNLYGPFRRVLTL